MSNTIDNMNLIKPLLTFRDDDDFYILEVMQRRKDGNDEVPSSAPRILRRYNVRSVEYLESRWNEIRRMCNEFNARAMIRLNVRSYKQVSMHTLALMATSMASGHHRLASSWDSAAGRYHNSPNKTWVIDLDTGADSVLSDAKAMQLLLSTIRDARPWGGPDKIVARIPSKTGLHLITYPFDPLAFSEIFKNIDIQKDNPTNLYIP